MPVDFTGNPAAFVEVGDGGPHDPQIKFTADDNSCLWNDFVIGIANPPAIDCSGFTSENSNGQQLLAFLTTPGPGGSGPTQAQWPYALVYGYFDGIFCGFTLQARLTFNAHGTTSLGSVAIRNAVTGRSCFAAPGPIIGDYDSGWVDMSCEDCTTASDDIALMASFTNFNPIPPAQVQVDNGLLQVRWFAPGSFPTGYTPDFPYSVVYNNPCSTPYSPTGLVSLGPGLFIQLPSDGCGNLYKTYQNIRDDVLALNIPITPAILGGHAFDIASADPSCPMDRPPFTYLCCPMAGAICSGGVDTPEGGGGGAG